jgi:hypothetical protein
MSYGDLVILGVLALVLLVALAFSGGPICPICDGLMFRAKTGKVTCLDCGWTRP